MSRSEGLLWIPSEAETLEDVRQNNLKIQRIYPEKSHTLVALVKKRRLVR